MRRRNTALATVGGVVAAAVFIGTPVALMSGNDKDTVDPAPPVPTPSVTEDGQPGWLTEIPAEFPLADGFPETNGLDGSPTEVVGQPRPLVRRHRRVPTATRTARWTRWITYTGESEDHPRAPSCCSRTSASVADYLEEVRELIRQCPTAPMDNGEDINESALVDLDLGTEDSVVVAQQVRADDGLLSQLTVTEFAQSGNALFVEASYGSAGGHRRASSVETPAPQGPLGDRPRPADVRLHRGRLRLGAVRHDVPVLSGSKTLIALAVLGSLLVPGTAEAAGARQPGSLTGYAFDTCSAPAQEVMDAWWESSPYAAVGIYIGGSNRLCTQPELDAAWVRKQQRTGWRLLPVQVGPQASCSGYADRMSSDLATAEQQGRAEAGKAVTTAQGLGIKKGSTLYYDLEDYDIGPDDCRRAALSFLSGWTKALHAKGYGSGVYSNIAAAITSLDYADSAAPGSYVMPDDIWFAWENGKADVKTDERVSHSDHWDDHARIHQYALDVERTYGGYPLTVDENWVDVGGGSVGSPSKALCNGVSVDLKAYPTRKQGTRGPAVEAAQCLLRRHGYTKAPITGTYDARTVAAVEKAQKSSTSRSPASWTGARGSPCSPGVRTR